MKLRMKNICLLFGLFYSATVFCQQKPVIDSNAYRNWPEAENPVLSNDGKYFVYIVSTQVQYKPVGIQKLIVKSTDGKWNKEIKDSVGEFYPVFSDDSKFLLFKTSKDRLGIISLGNSSISYQSNVSRFEILHNQNGTWIMFESQEHNILRNLENNKQLDVGPAEKVIVNALDEILLEKEISKDNGIRAISLIDVYTGKTRNIWTGKAKVQ